MNVALWSILNNDKEISGLARYDNELYNDFSKRIDCKIVRRKNNNIKSLKNYNKNRGNITHITTHQYALLNILKIKNSVLTVHDLIQNDFYSYYRQFKEFWIFSKQLLNTFDMYIVDSSYMKDKLIYENNINENLVNHVPLGVDHEFYKPMDKEKAREYFSLDPDINYLLSLSSGEKWKNSDFLKELKGDFEVLEVGYGRGRYGYIPENLLPALYSAVDLFVCPSYYEGFGLPVLEAMSCGTPCITSNETALPETLGKGGITVRNFCFAEWEDNISKILENKKYWSCRAIKQAENYSWKKCCNETLKVYERFY
jgi:glycosyltransferase involved in cell wall biosynthesis